MKRFSMALLSIFLSAHVFAKTEDNFNTAKQHPNTLRLFLSDMPKGGDLHNHLDGAVYAEEYPLFADDHFCLNENTMAVYAADNCPVGYQLNQIPAKNDALYAALIDSWSMRDFIPGRHSGHDHAFATFLKFAPIYNANVDKSLANAINRAGRQYLQYLELMLPIDNNKLIALADTVAWQNDFQALQQTLLAAGLEKIVAQISMDIDNTTQSAEQLMQCGTQGATSGCDVLVRYLYPVLRGMAPEKVFAQLLGAFLLADSNDRVLGINMVMPEDNFIVLRDYKLQMEMVRYLRQQFPAVHISLHAGELAQGLVVPNALATHISDAVYIAGAERIGHGVDIAYEKNARQLLSDMAARHIAVEINLSSNAKILGVKGDQHPLSLYLHAGVPIVISTDDEGVLRTDMTNELLRAVMSYDLDYAQLKQIIRNSIRYSFLPQADKEGVQALLEQQFEQFELRH